MSVEAPLSQSASSSRFDLLSLNKNRKKAATERKCTERIPTIVIQDESFDSLKQFITCRRGNWKHVSTSPIVIDDSFEVPQNDVSYIDKTPSPSKQKNTSKGTNNITPIKTGLTVDLTNELMPSPGGWSPAQNIICASPKFTPTPSRSKDIANESLEECSIKKIHQSHQNILDELYGDAWRSIPTLFKKKQLQNDADLEGISKKLNFFDNDDDNSEIFDSKILNYCDDRTNGISTPKTKFKNISFDNDTQNTDLNKVSFDNERPKTELKKVIRDNKRPTTDVKKKIVHDNESDKENSDLFDSDIKHFYIDKCFTPKTDLKTDTRTKKKLYTDKTLDTPEVRRIKRELLNFTDPKPKSKPTIDRKNNGTKSVKKLLQVEKPFNVTKLSFMGSLADNIPTWRCDSDALDFKTNYKTKRDQLARRLFIDFNKMVFDGCLENDMPVTWDSKLRTTAGTTMNRLIKTSNLVKLRTSSIKLSSKVIDGPQRLRDTLIHEMCHAATWIIDHEIRAGHGPLWKKWAKRALRVFPELEEVSRCHNLEIHYKYSYRCQQCGYAINRHSKSIDTTKKCCGYCRGKFALIVNKKTKDGVVVSTPAKQGEANDFALYVKENYAGMKDGTRTHAQVMKILGEQYSLKKKV